MDQEKELLETLDPFFKLPQVKIYWYDVVFKVGISNSLQPRRFLVSTTGIYLIRKKNFPSKFKIIMSISYCDLVSIYVAGNCASFSSSQYQIRFKHEEVYHIASLVYFIRQAQFPTDVLPCNFAFSDNKANEKPIQSPYQYDSLFVDRLLSCAFHYSLLVTKTMLCSIQLPTLKSFSISGSMFDSPLFPAILLSLTYEQDITNLHLIDLTVSPLLQQLAPLIRYNRFIQTITFEHTDFTDSASILDQLFSKTHGFRASNWIFERIEFNKSFGSFFDAISKIGKPIKSIEFKKCTYSIDVFRGVLQSVFFNDCFHSLEEFSVDSFKDSPELLSFMVLEIPTCSWAMQFKRLHKISVTECGIDGSDFLQKIMNFDVGLYHINLSGNFFKTPIKLDQNLVIQELQVLELSNCTFSTSFIESFVKLLKIVKIVELDLSHIQTDGDCNLTMILERLSTLTLPYLEAIAFNDNRMNSAMTCLFTAFIEKQVNLSSISLNSSIDIRESPSGLNNFIQCIQEKKLNNLSLRSDESFDFSYGQLLIPLIKGLNGIKSLDITNQKIQMQGLEELKRLINDGLMELHFNGSNVSSFEDLVSFCEYVLKSKIRLATFPTNDFTRLIRQLSMKNLKSDNEILVDNLKEQFSKNYTGYVIPRSHIFNRTRSISGKLAQEVEKIKVVPRSESLMKFQKQGIDSAITRTPELEKLLFECLEPEPNESKIDPVLIILSNLDTKYSMKSLLKQLKKQNE